MIRRILRRIDIAIADRVLPWRESDVDLYPVGARVVTGSDDEYEIVSRAYDFDEGKYWYLLRGENGDAEYVVHRHTEASLTVILPDDDRDSRTSAGDES